MKGWKIVSALMALVLCLGMVPQVVLASAEIAVEEPVLEELATTDASDRISLKNATVTLPQDSYKYTGNARKPKPTVTLNGVTLTKGTDYKVTYKNNTEVGTATVIIKGKGNYTGTVKITFKINPKGTTLSSVKSSAAGKIRIKWKKNAAVTGYQIQYSTKKSFSSAKKVTVKKNSTTSKTISDLKQGKKYYVRIRTYAKVNGETYFSAWSKSKTVKIKTAYDELLELYYDKVSNFSGEWEEGEFYNISMYLSGDNQQNALQLLGYCIRDISGDGIPELMIAESEGDKGQLLNVYTCVDDKPVMVFGGGYRDRFFLLDDGTIWNEGSSSAASSMGATCNLTEDGTALIVEDVYFTAPVDGDFSNLRCYHSKYMEATWSSDYPCEEVDMTVDEFWNFRTEYRDRAVTDIFTPLANWKK